jgi:hypothetical protein
VTTHAPHRSVTSWDEVTGMFPQHRQRYQAWSGEVSHDATSSISSLVSEAPCCVPPNPPWDGMGECARLFATGLCDNALEGLRHAGVSHAVPASSPPRRAVDTPLPHCSSLQVPPKLAGSAQGTVLDHPEGHREMRQRAELSR